MTHIPIQLAEQSADPRLRELFESVRRTLGGTQVPRLFLALGLNPAILTATLESYRATILEGRVPITLKKLIGQIIAEAYGYPAEIFMVPDTTGPANLAVLKDLTLLPTRQQTILAFARRAALTPGALNAEDFEGLRQAGLWDDEIFEILATARLFASLVELCQAFGLTPATPPAILQTRPTPAPVNDSLDALDPAELRALAQWLMLEGQALTTRLTALTEITLALTGTPVLGEIYQVLTDQAKWVIDFDQVSICLLDEAGEAYRLHTLIADCSDLTCEPMISPYETFAITEGLPGLAVTSGQPLLTGELGAHPRALEALDGRLAAAGLTSELIIPLQIGERGIGTLNFLARLPNHYDPDDLRVGRLLGLQLSAALSAARLYTQVEDERSTLAAVVESTADAVVVVDISGQMVIANPAAAALLGISAKATGPKTLAEAITLPALRALFESVMAEARPAVDDVTLPDGRVFRASLAPVQTTYGEIAGYVAVLHDISHLVELDRMKSEFVSTVSHDLKNPINIIQLGADSLARAGDLNQKQTEMVKIVQRASNRMLTLVSDLLDLGKIEAGVELRREPCELGELLREAMTDQQETATAKQLSLNFSRPMPAGGLWVQGDSERLKQVIANLLSNAIKYTPDGGQIWLEGELTEDQVRVCIRDTGYGIPPKDLPQIFGKFFRVQDTPAADIEGTGLGLAICRSIIEQHAGEITVDSEGIPGKGSTFCFTLPAAELSE